jgi:RNA polymerase sigma-70 factor (ECF subfamily)
MGLLRSRSRRQAFRRTDARGLLEAGIDRLPDAWRAVYVLRAIEQLPVGEVAVALGVSRTAVRVRFFRAMRHLRRVPPCERAEAREQAFHIAGAKCDRIVAGVLSRLGGP